MNQYIITEDELDDLAIYEDMINNGKFAPICNIVRSRPYNPQVERERVLDSIHDWVGEHHNCCGKRMVCYSVELSKFLDELRQEGKDGE